MYLMRNRIYRENVSLWILLSSISIHKNFIMEGRGVQERTVMPNLTETRSRQISPYKGSRMEIGQHPVREIIRIPKSRVACR